MYTFPISLAESKNKRRLDLLEDARKYGVGLVHIRGSTNKGGLTVAFRKSTAHTSGTMVTLAVSTCSNKDSFNRKVGTELALERFFRGETIELPILMNHAPEDISYVVKQAFTQLHNSYNEIFDLPTYYRRS